MDCLPLPVVLLMGSLLVVGVTGADELPSRFPNSRIPQSILVAEHARLPGDQVPLAAVQEAPFVAAPESAAMPPDLRALMRPMLRVDVEWQGETNDIALASYDARVQIPTYPVWGPPPPFISGGFSYTSLAAPESLDLPSDLYDYSLGASWLRRVNDVWSVRFMLSAAFATDGRNTGHDAWQFRGGLFAMYRPDETWTWIVGALALGRNDLPVVPAVGLIWQPSRRLRLDLTLPRPRLATLLIDQGARQQWVHVGGGLNGGTWAFERADGIEDQLTFRDWRVVVGWESTPTPQPGSPFTRGRKLGLELGYVFAREIEFDRRMPNLDLDDTFMIRVHGSL